MNIDHLEHWDLTAKANIEMLETYGHSNDDLRWIDNNRIVDLIAEVRELRKERDFYKRYYEFSTSENRGPDASPFLKDLKK